MASGADKVDNPESKRRFRRATVLWPATLECGERSIDCVVLDVSANGARVLLRDFAATTRRVTLKSEKFGAFSGEIMWQKPDSIGIRFDAAPADVARAFGGKLPLLPESKPVEASE
jgi:PilZ domain